MAKLRVLVVEDSLTIRALLESILEQDCDVVGLASDIDQARHMMAVQAPDVITLDLALPGTHGFDFLKELGGYGHAHVPVVVVSSSTMRGSADGKEAVRCGAAGCFDKARLIPEAPRLIRMLKDVALEHQRSRLAEMERVVCP